MLRKSFGLIFMLLLLSLPCIMAQESALELKLHTMFSHNMVLQREIPAKIWGVSKPGAEIIVQFAGQEKKIIANQTGNWVVSLGSLQASSSPQELLVTSAGESIKLHNVLVGDVWVCSGQSNMEWPVYQSQNAKKEIEEANHPEIRIFTVPRKATGTPTRHLQGEWKVCAPNTIGGFSAVGYFFGRTINQKLHIPIGLINSSWGGTPAESWTTFQTLENDPDLLPIVKRYKSAVSQEAIENYRKSLLEWEKNKGDRKEEDRLTDMGNQGFEKGWASQEFSDSDWKTMDLPCLWENTMNVDGAVWFRKEIQIPENWAEKDLSLTLGAVDDFDVTYFNGEKIGSIGEETPNWWSTPRKYTIPGKLVKAGKNCLAIRVFDHFGAGGFSGQPQDMAIQRNSEVLKISGAWKYKVEYAVYSSLKPTPPMGPENPYAPSTLYNGMISPIIPYSIKGAIWYQGESNAYRAYQYRKLLPAMISDWRREWAQEEPGSDFPFFIVQLANFMAAPSKPEESEWAELREAQAMTAFNTKNCGLALAIDIGDARDIHPRNKQEVGRRLALAALKTAYNKDIVFSGPVYDSMQIQDNKIVLNFKSIGSGLVARDGELKHFSIAGQDRIFVWAKARIEGSQVIVWSDEVKHPVAVRYAWANNPEGCNLYNQENLPAVPFRTDNWPGRTANSK